ncbi:Ets domain [Trinorchestia longiramus]|nr:Ets domain [Trinorchestia longiramus]
MVCNEVNQMMPSNGFGSPVSPPDVHFECREVPSPSQYSDPSFSPPSFHSPPHFSSGLDKQEIVLKEEPASPYNSYSYNTLIASQNSLQTDLGDTTIQSSESRQPIYNCQNFNAYQQALFNNCPTSKLNGSEVKGQIGMNIQKWDETKNSLDYELQQILSCTEEVNELETFTHQTFVNENSVKVVTVNHFQQQQQQQLQLQSHQQEHTRMPPTYNHTMQQQKLPQECQQSIHNQQEQTQGLMPHQFQTFHQQQQLAFEQQSKVLASDDAMKLLCSEPRLNPEASTTISVPAVGSLPSQTQPSEHNQNIAAESYPNFESIIDDSDIQATMDSNSNSATVVDCLKVILKKTIYDAGVPHNPYEWTASHVRAWLRKAATAFELKLPENIGNLNIDGPTMLSLNPNQFNSMLASKGDSSLHAVTTLLLILNNDARMVSNTGDCKEALQVKQEALCDEASQHLPAESASAMIPTTVVNHSRNSHFHLQSQNSDQSVTSTPPQNNLQVLSDRKPSLDQFVQLPAFPQPSASQQQQLQQAQHQQQRQFQQQHLLQQHPQTKMEQIKDPVPSPYPSLQVKQNIQQLNVPFSFSPQSPSTSSSQLPDNSVSSLYVSAQSPAPKTPVHGNVVTSKPVNRMPSPSNQPVPLQEGINSYINDSGADLSTLLQQQSPQHPATLDAEESMDTDEDVDDDVPASCTGGSGRSHIQLWQFLKELLNNNKKYGSCIRWLDRQEAIFKIEDSVKVASLWGERKNRPQMNYDKLSRSIRQYYNKNIMKKTERSQRLVYQFCSPYGQ